MELMENEAIMHVEYPCREAMAYVAYLVNTLHRRYTLIQIGEQYSVLSRGLYTATFAPMES